MTKAASHNDDLIVRDDLRARIGSGAPMKCPYLAVSP